MCLIVSELSGGGVLTTNLKPIFDYIEDFYEIAVVPHHL